MFTFSDDNCCCIWSTAKAPRQSDLAFYRKTDPRSQVRAKKAWDQMWDRQNSFSDGARVEHQARNTPGFALLGTQTYIFLVSLVAAASVPASRQLAFLLCGGPFSSCASSFVSRRVVWDGYWEASYLVKSLVCYGQNWHLPRYLLYLTPPLFLPWHRLAPLRQKMPILSHPVWCPRDFSNASTPSALVYRTFHAVHVILPADSAPSRGRKLHISRLSGTKAHFAACRRAAHVCP